MIDFAQKAAQSEQALMGAAMLTNGWLVECDIKPEEFLNSDHRQIWSAICELLADRQPVDLVTVDALLKRKGFNWTAYLSQLSRNTPSAANWSAYASALRKYSGLAKTAEILAAAQTKLGKGEAVADEAISQLMSLSNEESDPECTTKDMLRCAVDLLEDRKAGRAHALTTGLSDLDKVLGGFHDSDLIVIAGRPAMGKTAVLLNMTNAAGVPVGVISTEQPREQIGMRLLSINGSVPVERMRTGQLTQGDWDGLTKAMHSLTTRDNIFINDRSFMTVLDVARQARRWKHKHGIKALFVDYIQRIKGGDPKAPKHERVGDVVRSLKDIARELHIPVIALAQVSRSVEARTNRRPTMGDISDSSEIEKEADQVITLYRDEVYDEHSQQKGILEMDICKNRHGGTGKVPVLWRGEYMQVRNLAKAG